MTDNELTPHGRLLEKARGTMSQRKAAEAAGISDARWRQIVRGVQPAGDGQTIKVTTKPATLAAMANAVGADVNEVLVAAGMPPMAEPGPDVYIAMARDHITLAEASLDELLDELASRRQISSPSRGHQRRDDHDRAGEPPADDPDDVEPR